MNSSNIFTIGSVGRPWKLAVGKFVGGKSGGMRRILTSWMVGWVCCACLLSGSFLFAQETADGLRLARMYEAKGDYAAAAACYEHLLQSEGSSGSNGSNGLNGAETRYGYAHCLRHLYEYRMAEEYYTGVWQTDSVHFPDALYYKALMKKQQADYETALRWFERYIQNQKGDKELLRRAPVEVAGCRQALEDLRRPAGYDVQALPSSVNSSYTEFNARPCGDSLLYFSAMRPVTKNADVQWLGDYYRAQMYACPLPISSKVNVLPKQLNHPQYHNANLCVNAQGTRLYFTRSPISGPADANVEIWMSERMDGRWQKPVRLGAPVNLPSSVSTQPFVAEQDGKEVLYFVSDRTGGMGGTDIWYSIREADGFQEAVNAGPMVNSSANEVTPFYETGTRTLYFSSDGFAGMGGFDIFSIKGGLSAWQLPLRHLPPPINSPANDVYFVFSDDTTHGYFASNRRSAYALSEPVCCNDLFAFTLHRQEPVVLRDTLWAKEPAARSAKALIPLTLYFHNDEPDPHSESDTTTLDYTHAWQSYMKRQSQYEDNYSSGHEGLMKEYARLAVRRFFEDSVRPAHQKLQDFFLFLREDLETGHRVRIGVEGHASPLHTSAYNLKLSSRRIQCFWNSLCRYENGFFLPYLQTGRLVVEKDPMGKERPKRAVSGNLQDQRNSVYGVEAALERYIQLARYESDALPSGRGGGGFPSPDILEIQLLLPDTHLVLRERPGTDEYLLYVQLKNEGESEICLNHPQSSDSRVRMRLDSVVIKPKDYLFVVVKCPAELFSEQPIVDLSLGCESMGYKNSIRLSLSFFKQK